MNALEAYSDLLMGTMSQQNANAVAITGGTISGCTLSAIISLGMTGSIISADTTDSTAIDTGSVRLAGGFYAAKQGRMANVVVSQSTKTSNYTLTPLDAIIRADCAGGSITVTLPAAAAGERHTIIRTVAGPNLVTIAGTIDGLTNYLLTEINEAVTIVGNGTSWETVS